MDYNLIETFIVIGEIKNLSRASKLLYKTQPTISNRIQQLEDILGYSLIVRKRGKQSIEITPKGETFLKIAKKLFELYNEIPLENEKIANSLAISSISSYEIPIVSDVCKKLVSELNTNISLYTYQTTDAYNLISQKKLDIAFVSRAENIQGVVCKPVFAQNYYVIKQCQHPKKMKLISSSDLDVDNEIYQEWDNDFRIWHDHSFSDKKPKIQVDSCAILKEFLVIPNYWTIIQESNLYALERDISVQIYKLTDPPPQRMCYLLTNRFPDRKIVPLIKKFKELLAQYISNKNGDGRPLS